MEKIGLKHIDLTDVELVEKALEGSQSAYFSLYTRYKVGVCAQIARIIQDQVEIEDVCMESFEKAFKQLSTFKKDSRFSTWILTIARNTSLDHKDKEKTRVKRLDTSSLDATESDATKVVDPSISPEDEFIKSQLHEKFINSIEGLPELYRDISRLCFIDNLGYKEISEQTGVPINTVKTRIRRAKEMLSKIMQENEE